MKELIKSIIAEGLIRTFKDAESFEVEFKKQKELIDKARENMLEKSKRTGRLLGKRGL